MAMLFYHRVCFSTFPLTSIILSFERVEVRYKRTTILFLETELGSVLLFSIIDIILSLCIPLCSRRPVTVYFHCFK